MRPSLLPALLCIPAALAAQPAATPVPQGAFEMRCANGRITVASNEAPVERLLSEFSQKSGVTFNKFVGKSATATLDLRDAAYEEFLSRVLGSYVAKSRKIDGQAVVNAVTVMDEGPGSPPAVPPPPISGADPSIKGERLEETPAREEALRRRRRRRRPRDPGPEASEPAANPENPPPDAVPPPENPPPDAVPPPDQPPPDGALPPDGNPSPVE